MGVTIPTFYAKHIEGPNAGSNVPDGFVFFDDFLSGIKASTSVNTTDWLVTRTGSGSTIVADAGAGGYLAMTPGSSANDAEELQLNGEIVKVVQGKPFRFAARVKWGTSAESIWYLGIATTDTTVIAGINDFVGFRKTTGSATTFQAACIDDTTATTITSTGTTASYVTHTDGAFQVLAFEGVWGVGGYVDFWVDGNYVGRISSNLPDVGAYMTLVMAQRSTSTNAAPMTVDWVKYEGIRE